MNPSRAWHFAGDTLRDGSPLPEPGVWLPTISDPKPCVRGYHASPDPLSALGYAPGPMVALVELGDVVVTHGDPPDKWAASNRRALRRGYVDATAVLRAFSCRCALDVARIWKMPQAVREYLESDGMREALRAAAARNARDAARNARDAASAAAWAAARAAAWDAWAAARDAAWAASNAARAVAWAESAAVLAARDAQRVRLTTMLEELLR